MKTVREFAERLTCQSINVKLYTLRSYKSLPGGKKKCLLAAQASPAFKSIKANALNLTYSHITHVVAVSHAS